MIFADIPAGASVFVDANMLVYHFALDPMFGPPCTELLLRIKQRDILGYTSTHIVAEMAHRLNDSDFDRESTITRYAPV